MESDYGGSYTNNAQPLYIVDSIYFTITVSAHVAEADSEIKGTAFAGMTDQEGQGEHKEQESYFDYGEQQHWVDPHTRRVDRNAHPATEVQHLAWEDCILSVTAPCMIMR